MPQSSDRESLRRFYDEFDQCHKTGKVERTKLFSTFRARYGTDLNHDNNDGSCSNETSGRTRTGSTSPVKEEATAVDSSESNLIDFAEFFARVEGALGSATEGHTATFVEVTHAGNNQAESRTPPAMERNLFLSALANGKLAVSGKREVMRI